MFNVIILSANANRARLLRVIAIGTGRLLPLRELDSIPDSYALGRLLNSVHPALVLLDLTGGPAGLACASEIGSRWPGLPVIGLGAEALSAAQLERHGVSSWLPAEPDSMDLMNVVGEALHKARGDCEQNLFTFLPAKAGCGASTVVLNTAACLARAGHSVLVLEADLRSGALLFMLDAHVEHDIQGVLSGAAELDELRLENAVVHAHDVDFLLTSRRLDAPPAEWSEYYKLLEVARTRYDTILVDLPALVNAATVGFARRSHMVFNVCTPEVLPLKLARHRLLELDGWGVPQASTALLVNRWQRREVSINDIEELLERPVRGVFPNDYQAVSEAISAGRPVAASSRLGKAFASFAETLARGGGEAVKQSLGARLMSLFESS